MRRSATVLASIGASLVLGIVVAPRPRLRQVQAVRRTAQASRRATSPARSTNSPEDPTRAARVWLASCPRRVAATAEDVGACVVTEPPGPLEADVPGAVAARPQTARRHRLWVLHHVEAWVLRAARQIAPVVLLSYIVEAGRASGTPQTRWGLGQRPHWYTATQSPPRAGRQTPGAGRRYV
jgi:hypothetical protein